MKDCLRSGSGLKGADVLSAEVRAVWQRGRAQPGMVHRVVNAAWVVVSLPFRPHCCAPLAEILRSYGEPIEPLRLVCSGEVGQRQNTADTVGHRYASDIDPVRGLHRTAELQLIRLACDGDYIENDVCSRNMDSSDLINWIRRRVKGNSQFEHGAFVVRPAEAGRAVEITVAALHQPVWIGSIGGGTAKGVQSRFGAAIKLAADFGISNVAIAKRCKRLNVPRD